MNLLFSWPLPIWLSLVLAGLVVGGGSRPVRLPVKLVVPNEYRPMFLECKQASREARSIVFPGCSRWLQASPVVVGVKLICGLGRGVQIQDCC